MREWSLHAPAVWFLGLALACPVLADGPDSAAASAPAPRSERRDSTHDWQRGLFGDMFYVSYLEGVAVYLRDPRNGYVSAAKQAIVVGNTIEPEVGLFVAGAWQSAIAYIYMDGKSEASLDSGYVYDDVFLSALAAKGRIALVRKPKVRLLVGGEILAAKCRLKSDTTGDLDWHRGMGNDKASGDYVSDWRMGGGICMMFLYRPVRFLSMGIDAGVRLIYSDKLENTSGTAVLLTSDGDPQKLSFSSIGVRAFLSLHL